MCIWLLPGLPIGIAALDGLLTQDVALIAVEGLVTRGSYASDGFAHAIDLTVNEVATGDVSVRARSAAGGCSW